MSERAFSSIDQVVQCMMDLDRSAAFQAAIQEVVRPGMRVLDVGTGTGLLALFAAQAGAREVIALEHDPYVANVARDMIRCNHLSHIVRVHTCDATMSPLHTLGHFDAVLMELLTTGMIDELQVPAFNHLWSCGLIDETSQVVPGRIVTKATLVNADFSLLGLEMRVIRHSWFDFPGAQQEKPLTEEVIVDDVAFDRPITQHRATDLTLSVTASGIANAIVLRSITDLSESNSIEDTMTLNAPVIIPLVRDVELIAGSAISLRLSFRAGGGFESLRVDVDATAPRLARDAA